jgi:flagellar basal-body rod protein FlgB
MSAPTERHFVCPFFDAMTGFSDNTMRTAAAALNGLAARSKIRAHNIANTETPGYRARTVAFEERLSEALQRGDTSGMSRSEMVAESIRDGGDRCWYGQPMA